MNEAPMKVVCDQCQTTFVNNSAFPCKQCGAMSFGELMPITNTEMEDAPWNSPEFEEWQRKQRRTEWIRENVARLVCRDNLDWVSMAIADAEYLADVLEKRGYL